MAKNQNTFEKRRRETEKKFRATEKRKKREAKKQFAAQPAAGDSSESGGAGDGRAPE